MTTPLFRVLGGGGDSQDLMSGVLLGAGVVLAALGVFLVAFPSAGLGPAAGPAAENGTVAPPATPTSTPTASATGAEAATATTAGTEPTTEVVYRVNAGGPPLAPSGDGPGWSGDTAAHPSAYTNAERSGSRQTGTGARITLGPSVPAGTPKELFGTGRYDDDDPDISADDPEMRWSFPVQRGETYVVRLYFAEIWLNETGIHANEDVGPRRFDVRIEGEGVMERYDIYDDVGPDRGTMKEFRVTATDDTLEVTFRHVVENPHVSGIEILRVENETRADAGTTGD